MAYTGPIYFSGDMMAKTATQPSAPQGLNRNDENFGMVVNEASALSDANSLYRLTWYQNVNNPDTTTEFRNGQFWRVEVYDGNADADTDPTVGNDGWSVVYNNLVPKDDLVQGMGAGDEVIVFELQNTSPAGQHLLYDLNGGLSMTPTTLTYLETNENGDPEKGDNDGQLDFADAYAAYNIDNYNIIIPCFAQGTFIETAQGARPIQDLAVGDMIRTCDNDLQPIRWIGSRKLSAAPLAAHEHLRPIRIKQHALGLNVPSADLLVSPQHRILVRSRIAQRMFNTNEVLVAAKHLCQVDGIDIADDITEVEYFHILFDRHEVVTSNGAETESLYTGPEALKAISAAAREEIFAIFPQLQEYDYAPISARMLLTGRTGRKLADRHAQNAKMLVSH